MDASEKYIKMCESAKDIQRQWNFKIEDYIFDPADGEARVWFGYPKEEYSEIVWLPRQNQLQEICIEFFMQNLGMSRREAFFHFLGWYASCIKETFDNGCNVGENGEYEELNSCEELMLKYTMMLIHWKRWDGERWVK
ncbi:MAG: hypothetical protein EHM20_03560 [Alphaproteobacteria bacterium]|nr:MAG: hypothetical protein EHM20_03560 [Alphaproteobacteria bacterium]